MALFHAVLGALVLANGIPLVFMYAQPVPPLDRLQADAGTVRVTGGKKSTFLSLRSTDGRIVDFSCRHHPMSSSYCLPLSDDGSVVSVRWYWAGVYPFLRVRRVMQIERDGNELKSYARTRGAMDVSRAIFSACEAVFLLVWFLGARKLARRSAPLRRDS